MLVSVLPLKCKPIKKKTDRKQKNLEKTTKLIKKSKQNAFQFFFDTIHRKKECKKEKRDIQYIKLLVCTLVSG